ncbi:hypothetical protein ACQP1G_19665 [Nocardia sp. CA-107356]|uniref:hypothetical protein n=1 Tax=Nocardia sp. CA-107356 TaxID=3239972 RepID=UPI003D8EB7B7
MDAPAVDTEEFMTLAQQYRPELIAHCHGMLSPEDAVGDVLAGPARLRAVRGALRLRLRLYRIATNGRGDARASVALAAMNESTDSVGAVEPPYP